MNADNAVIANIAGNAETPMRPYVVTTSRLPSSMPRSRTLSAVGDVGIVGDDGVPHLALRHIHGILAIHNAPVAQLDRVCDFGSQGCRFEPCRVQ